MCEPVDVAAAYRWGNGNVMVFDRDGHQIPELQGRHTPELEAAIRARSDGATIFCGFDGDPCVWPSASAPHAGEGKA